MRPRHSTQEEGGQPRQSAQLARAACVALSIGAVFSSCQATGLHAQDADLESPTPLFNWDLVSLEQNNPRFNASVLSGFHSVRSAGVTPARGWKTGLGVLYSREEQVAVSTNTQLFNQELVIINPKVHRGFLDYLEVGTGLEFSWASGKSSKPGPSGIETRPQESIGMSAVDWGVKWGAPALGRLRWALSLDGRVAVDRKEFGRLPVTLYNAELDVDYIMTRRLSLLGNLQFMTSDHFWREDQVMLDLAASYTFHDRFRGMIFGTALHEEVADNALFFVGLAGQYVFEQHSFSLSLDVQVNEANRDVRTQQQIDLSLSYTFTF